MNQLSAGIKEVWDTQYQVTHHKLPVYPAISNFRLESQLQHGDTVHRQYREELVTNDMGSQGEYQRQAIIDVDETLVIDHVKETSFYIKDLDKLQNHLPVQLKHSYDAMVAIFNQVDSDILGTYDQFDNVMDAGNLGGTPGQGIAVTSSNVQKLFTGTTLLLQRSNLKIDNAAKFTGFKMEDSKREMGVAVISPEIYATILERLEEKVTALGDKVSLNGHCGSYLSYQLFVSNNLAWTGTLNMATNPTAGDTVTVNGVTFEFVAAPATAGQVDIGANADASRANLVSAIMNSNNYAPGAGSASTYFEVSASDRKILKGITATNDNTADTMAIKALGKGTVKVAETFTDGTDAWQLATQVQHCLFGIANAIDVVIQKTPSALVKDRDGFVGKDIVTWTAYGYKVFNEGRPKMVDIQVRTDSFA